MKDRLIELIEKVGDKIYYIGDGDVQELNIEFVTIVAVVFGLYTVVIDLMKLVSMFS